MDNGARMEDLALVMQISKTEMQNMIQELQMNGQVYQNDEGKYVPL
jgi:Mn-dependent DtxR family transcriptional regulator